MEIDTWLALNRFLDEDLSLAERLREAREARRWFDEEVRKASKAVQEFHDKRGF